MCIADVGAPRSPARIARVVWLTEKAQPGSLSRTRLATVVFPVPLGAVRITTIFSLLSGNVLHLLADALKLDLGVDDR